MRSTTARGNRLVVLNCLLLCLGGMAATGAVPVYVYDANSNSPPDGPTSQGWTENDSTAFTNAITGDDGSGYNAWQIAVTNGNPGSQKRNYGVTYTTEERDTMVANGFSARWRVRMPLPMDATRAVTFETRVGPNSVSEGARRFAIQMYRDAAAVKARTYAPSQLLGSVNLSDPGDYHLWTFTFDGTNNGSGARLFVDYHQMMEWTHTWSDTGTDVQWGAVAPTGTGTGNWNRVEIYTNVIEDPPTPSAIISYSADSNTPPESPTSEGWSETGAAPTNALTDDAGTGYNAWQIADGDTGNNRLYYFNGLSDADRTNMLDNGFGARWRLRMPAVQADNRAVEAGIEVGDQTAAGSLRWSFTLSRDATALKAKVYDGSQYVERSLTVEDPGGYHLWTFIFDGTNTADNTSSLYLDYDLLMCLTNFANHDVSYDVMFGSVVNSAVGTSCWNLVELHRTKLPIPEEPARMLQVAGSDGGGVTNNFWIASRETTVEDFLEYLNTQTNGEIAVTNGEVRLAATGDRLCLTSAAEAGAYLSYSTGAPLGERFAAVSNRDEHPMIYVSWFGAAAYCNWKSQEDGLDAVYAPSSGWSASLDNNGYRLPAEAEWYKAAAWDADQEAFRLYGTSADTLAADDANYLNSGDTCETNAVPTCPAESYDTESPYGLKDASGNVWEWCHGFYDAGDADPDVDAHALRGGSWCNLEDGVRTDRRSGLKPEMAVDSGGFRIMTKTEPGN